MPLINVDDREDELDAWSDEAKSSLASLRFVDAEIEWLSAQLAGARAARVAYVQALQRLLPSDD